MSSYFLSEGIPPLATLAQFIYLVKYVSSSKKSHAFALPAKPHMLSMLEVDIDLTDKRHWSVRPPIATS